MNYRLFLAIAILTISCTLIGHAQTTEFNFQGSLKDGASEASGNYDFEFLLFDSAAAGSQLGPTLPRIAVPISAGVFSVNLDFGDQFTSGGGRWLEIRVRPSGSPTFTSLAPRSAISSAPYAVRSLNAATANAMSANCIGCVNAANIASVNGAAVTGAIPVASVPTGSSNYVQNTSSPQVGTNFNITGNGTVGGKMSAQTVNTTTRYELGNQRIVGVATGGNLYVGLGAGAVTTTGQLNTFVGSDAGLSNTIGAANAFFGINAGKSQTEGFSNSFFGKNAGAMNVSSEFNAFFGAEAGGAGTSGNGNSFFGAGAGFSNDGELNSFFGNGAGSMGSGGNLNSFFGAGAGRSNISSNNAFFGAFSGVLNVTGGNNAFFGFESGWQNENACCNSFFGSRAGRMNTSGGGNAFFGNRAGQSNTNACCNTYIGDQAGDLSTTGTNNVFVGAGAGDTNTTGSDNTIVGAFAGSFHSTGTGNTFVGRDAGDAVTTGQNNTFIGIGTDHANGGFRSFGTAIGAFAKTTNDSSTAIGNRSYVEGFNSIVLGSIAGINGAQSTAKVGIGLTMPQASLHIRDNSGDIKLGSPFSCVAGFAGIGFGPNFNCQTYALLGGDGNTIINRSGGGIIQFRESNVAQVTINAGGTVSISALGSGGSTQLCRNASNTISTCSSSLKYKTGLTGFQSGMSFVNRLRPISFNWKEDGLKDVGFGAEDLAAIDPRFVTLNDRGEVEGVKYDRLSTVFVNAFKEQQKEIDDLRAQVGALKKLVCSTNRDADICK